MIKTLLTVALSSLSLLIPTHSQAGRGEGIHLYVNIAPQKTLSEPRIAPLEPLSPVYVNKLRPFGTYANSYDWGNCTFYVASRLPIPNDWNNANNWAYAATLAGYTVSSVPKAGEIAQTTGDSWAGHVAVVESVNPDGSFVISEMNAEGLGVIDSRITSTAEFPNFIIP